MDMPTGNGRLLLLSGDMALTAELNAHSRLAVSVVDSTESLVQLASAAGQEDCVEMAVLDASGYGCDRMMTVCQQLRQSNPQIFLCVYGKGADVSAHARQHLAEKTGAMLCQCAQDIVTVSEHIQVSLQRHEGDTTTHTCPACNRCGLTEDGLWHHYPLYHASDTMNTKKKCPVCKQQPAKNLRRHLRNHHGPALRGEVPVEPDNEELNVLASAMAVVQRSDKRILMVLESRSRGYWLPGGKLVTGEGLCEAAKREVLEETGMQVELVGVLKFEFIPRVSGSSLGEPCRIGD
ncbi:uncharacterized protein LOC135820153 isoform X2 [Sycon ciliatum]|uniref:uncharacterized protein LOC135820153 isoform X2 n=1 Tax=Sycon ciliatum TaxID=27933 RepID=UPI0031F61B23